MDKFTVGDAVQLNSGGPKMTVQEVRNATPASLGQEHRCQWPDGSNLNEGWFLDVMLKRVDVELL